jgi:hypothetical protein
VANVSETVENIYLQDLLQGDSTALGIGQKMHFHPDTNFTEKKVYGKTW